jgi:predicted lipid-binding transport protein (Tim44 family)
MRDVFDIYTIIFLALAVFIFLRLRSVLGQRTGRERPPYDPYSAREPVRPGPEKVVALPNRTKETAAPKPAEPAEVRPSDGKASPKRAPLLRAALMPLPPPIRVSMPSIFSPARAPLMK